jgi:opacity protein-like surface antigen
MRKTVLLTIVVSLIAVSCSQAKKSPIAGAWKLAYEFEKSGDKVTIIYPGINTGSEIKMWSDHNFIFVGRFKEDSTFTDSFGGGTYSLNGNRYEENVEYHSSSDYLGKKVKLLLELRGDTIIQTWPVDDNGQITASKYYTEKWARLK